MFVAVALVATGLTGTCAEAQVAPVRPPRKVKDVKPVYPAESLSAGDEGWVIVDLTVAPSGSVTDARVIGSKCPALNEAALTAVRAWQFEPVRINGEASTFRVTATVPFRLPEKLKSRAARPGNCKWTEPPKPIR
jgi:TonB family protein